MAFIRPTTQPIRPTTTPPVAGTPTPIRPSPIRPGGLLGGLAARLGGRFNRGGMSRGGNRY